MSFGIAVDPNKRQQSGSQQDVGHRARFAGAGIEGKGGLLVGTRAFKQDSGPRSIGGRIASMDRHGFEAKWKKLRQPMNIVGVGNGGHTCTYQATLVCALEGDRVMKWSTFVIDIQFGDARNNGGETPPLLGSGQTAQFNTHVSSRTWGDGPCPATLRRSDSLAPGTRTVQR